MFVRLVNVFLVYCCLSGECYPPKTLKEIVALIQHYFNVEFKHNWSVFCDQEFRESRYILDATMKKLAREGLVRPVKRAEVVSLSHMKVIFGIMGEFDISDFFLIAINFC